VGGHPRIVAAMFAATAESDTAGGGRGCSSPSLAPKESSGSISYKYNFFLDHVSLASGNPSGRPCIAMRCCERAQGCGAHAGPPGPSTGLGSRHFDNRG
jgi:hypothetical protein